MIPLYDKLHEKMFDLANQHTGFVYEDSTDVVSADRVIADSATKQHFFDGMQATFYVTNKRPCCGKRLFIPFVPGLARIGDAAMFIISNALGLVFMDLLAGIGQAICKRKLTRLKNFPKRLVILFRNTFHLIAGAFLLVPGLGAIMAKGVYKLSHGIEHVGVKVAKLITCNKANVEGALYTSDYKEEKPGVLKMYRPGGLVITATQVALINHPTVSQVAQQI